MDNVGKKVNKMIKIKNNVITITKGDSASIKVTLRTEDGEEYVMHEGDKLIMTVRKKFESPVLIQIESATNIIDLFPKDTKCLEKGPCVYDIELQTSAGDVFTVVGINSDIYRTNMIVISEVTE